MKMNSLIGAAVACGVMTAFADHSLPVEAMDWNHEVANTQAKTPRMGWHQIAGGTNWRGLIVRTPSRITIPVGKGLKRIKSVIAVTDSGLNNGHDADELTFRLIVNGKDVKALPKVTHGEKDNRKFQQNYHYFDTEVPETDAVTLVIEGPEGMEAVWSSIEFTYADGCYPPNDVRMNSPQLGILTPPEGKAPRINGATIFGVRPGHPVLYRVSVTGEKPMNITIDGLEKAPGLRYDAAKRILSGVLAQAGDYPLVIHAKNAQGEASRPFTLRVGEKIALTPALGFNSWNCYQVNVTQADMEKTADAFVSTGLADHGWQYVVVDDFWQNSPSKGKRDKTLAGPERNADGTINTNARFPNMKGMADHIHALGLKAGLYSSPGPTTCGGCTGSWQHEEQDAKTYADWGFDFLKYDWCSYDRVAAGSGRERAIKPYRQMGAALRAQNRDILFSLCQYGMENVSSWGESVHGQSWRTTGDVFDLWPSISGSIAKQKNIWKFVHPGAWNDPDMLCVGAMKWNGYKGSRLAPNEQYTHISIWALVASPMMIGCDLTKLDAFTYSLLANDEVLDINQDPLGAAAAVVAEADDWEIWARPLADGSIAAGLYNKSVKPLTITLDFAKLGIEGAWKVRDLWRQANVGTKSGAYSTNVPGHATTLVRLIPAAGGRLRSGVTDIRTATR